MFSPDLKISLITVSFNAESTIERCIQSVLAQSFKNVEYIIIDGASTDNTLQIIHKYKQHIQILVSEPDKGIYDAMNKGIKMATGDIIGMLNTDDYFADAQVLKDIAGQFTVNNADITYGDLDFVNNKGGIVRKWRSGKYFSGSFNWGWMPPHPTFYCKKELFQQFGYYSLGYGTAADYELMLRFMHKNGLKASYLNKVIIKMKTGGASNKNLNSRVKGLLFDLKAMRNNGIKAPLLGLIFKPLRKISQYF
ncbi:glycosyltransferase family 2 protein [Mucilaginibacter gotjawali]|uniref:Glycosyltransferase involved in cell wall biosynthesis n=1 Tax=Mucilaginibacter gotjawali TaxID=1550579 RepID=A0A839SKL6_9SPHI|nr:glycosyltransferase family 2 protein [Mucilaginibacter gotjawali]MBB3057079.1 glycosyltransferase involved in cell wall biosynthesis [Mucilaginibacter gotjawali]